MDEKTKKIIKYALIAFAAFILFMIGTGSYNSMVDSDEESNNAWAQVQNAYQRRGDLIPNLMNIVQGTADFEKSTLVDVISARAKATSITIDPSKSSAADLQNFKQVQDNLGSTLSRLMVVAERYPELKSNQSFLELQSQLESTENRISVERKKFNTSVKEYNQLIRNFPKNFFAKLFGFNKKAYFEADFQSAKAPTIKFNTK